jgi:hypothetical protein
MGRVQAGEGMCGRKRGSREGDSRRGGASDDEDCRTRERVRRRDGEKERNMGEAIMQISQGKWRVAQRVRGVFMCSLGCPLTCGGSPKLMSMAAMMLVVCSGGIDDAAKGITRLDPGNESICGGGDVALRNVAASAHPAAAMTRIRALPIPITIPLPAPPPLLPPSLRPLLLPPPWYTPSASPISSTGRLEEGWLPPSAQALPSAHIPSAILNPPLSPQRSSPWRLLGFDGRQWSRRCGEILTDPSGFAWSPHRSEGRGISDLHILAAQAAPVPPDLDWRQPRACRGSRDLQEVSRLISDNCTCTLSLRWVLTGQPAGAGEDKKRRGGAERCLTTVGSCQLGEAPSGRGVASVRVSR